MKVIDLRSDTVTRPTPEMRRAMASADVGDDVFGDDPTVIELEANVARLFDREAALYVPSGTMGNQICLKSISQPGWELLCDRDCHAVCYECAGPAVHSGLLVNLLTTEYGMVTAQMVRDNFRGKNLHTPETKIVELENTHNRHGGTILPMDEVWAVRKVCDELGLLMHLDGARIWNAHVATGISLADLTRPFDTISCCLSKGLGAPVGSMVVGSRQFIERARRERKLFGGGMRQAGIIAAGGLYAVKNNIPRLAEDHANARILAEGLGQLPCFDIDMKRVQTNIVIANITNGETSDALVQKMKTASIWAVPFGAKRIRFVTHLDVSRDDCNETLGRLKRLFN